MILSICIATYNRADCLVELLESICSQGVDDIEIIIGDDASTDVTEKVAKRFAKLLSGLRYTKHKSNIGADRNFLFVVSQASSKFVWLVGDDDRLAPGALTAVISKLEQWPEICGLTPGVIDYDSRLKQPTGIRYMPDTAKLQGTEEVFENIVELVGFISVTVVNRKMWLHICENNLVNKYLNNYIQVYIIACMVGPLGCWGVLNIPCVHFRTGNDQTLLSAGWLKRLELDVNSYSEIFSEVFKGNNKFIAKMNRRILQRHIMSRIYNAKIGGISYKEIFNALVFLFKNYGRIGYFWLYTIPTLITPAWMLEISQQLYRKYSASSGTKRARTLLSEGSSTV